MRRVVQAVEVQAVAAQAGRCEGRWVLLRVCAP